MKIKVNDLYNLATGFQDLVNKELPIKMALDIQRNAKKINDELSACDKLREKIANKYKEKKLDDGSFKIKKEKFADYRKDIDELMQQDIEINLKKIKVNELSKNIETLKPKTLMLIESIIDAK